MLNTKEHIRSTLIIHSFVWLLTILLLLVMVTLIERSSLPRELYFHGYLTSGIFLSAINILMFYWLYFHLNAADFFNNRTMFVLELVLCLIVAFSISTTADIYFYTLNFDGAPFRALWTFAIFNSAVKFYFAFMAIFTRFAVDWINQIASRNAIQLEIQKTELAMLKSQTNPHFLFNTLNALYSSAYQFGDNQTATGIASLSNLLRYMLFHNNKSSVNLSLEIEHIQDYIVLQQQRYQGDLNVSFVLASDMQYINIAPMLLMPLVENAFKYGIKPNKRNHIEFKLTCNDNKLIFISINSDHSALFKHQQSNANSGFGLDNLRKRLNILYPSNHQLTAIAEQDYFNIKLEIICD